MRNLPVLFCLLICTSFLSLSSCKTNKGPTGDQPTCDQQGTVKDFTGLDGCGLMIVAENGEKLLPSKLPSGVVLEAGQRIRFGYKTGESMASICMAEDKIVEITCLEVTGADEIPQKKKCEDTDRPQTISWMKAAITTYRPNTVTKYAYRTDGFAYLFKGENAYLYDCQGNLICEEKGPDPDSTKCLKMVENPKEGSVIWKSGK